MADYIYDAFISYRHSDPDRIIAGKLHKLLEDYRIPRGIVAKNGIKKLGRVFRDRDELPSSSNLGQDIKTALENSKFLIVICSPRTPESKWVCQEIDIFGELHGYDKILALLIEGEPEESFPQNLRFVKAIQTNEAGEQIEVIREIEPLAADIRPDSIKDENTYTYDIDSPEGKKLLNKSLKLLQTEKLRLLAPILGCRFDDLRQRQRERLVKRAAALAAGLSLFFFSFGSFSFYQSSRILEQSKEISLKNTEIEQKNRELEEQIKQTQEQKLLAEANERIAKQNEQLALDNAEEANLQKMEAQRQAGIAMENEALAIANAEEAMAQRKEAERQASIARSQRDTALKNQSLYLTDLSSQQLRLGDRTTAMLLALEGLPKSLDNPDRPFVPETAEALANALLSNKPFIEAKIDHSNSWFVRYNYDGSRFVVADDETVAIYDAVSGKCLKTITLPGEDFWSARLSRDGKRIVTESLGDYITIGATTFRPATIKTWDAENGELLASYHMPYPSLELSEISPDGKSILIKWEDQDTGFYKAAVFHVDTLKKAYDIKYTENINRTEDIKLTADWKYLFALSGDHLVVRQGANGKILVDKRYPNFNVKECALNIEYDRLIYKTPSEVIITNLLNGAISRYPAKPSKTITDATINPDGTEMIVDYGSSFEVVDIAQGKTLMKYNTDTSDINFKKFSPGGKWICLIIMGRTNADANRIILWDTASHGDRFQKEIDQISGELYDAILSPDDMRLIIDSNTVLTIWNFEGLEQAKPIYSSSLGSVWESVNDIKFSADGKMVLVVCDKEWAVLDTSSWKLLCTYKLNDYIQSAVFSADNKKVLTAYFSDAVITSVDIASGEEELLAGVLEEGCPDAAVFSPDGTIVLTSCRFSRPVLRDLRTGKEIGKLSVISPVNYRALFNREGDKVITADYDGYVRIWDARTTKLLHVLKGHSDKVFEIALSLDGNKLATLSYDNTIRIWDTEIWEEILKINTPSAENLCFSPDGSKVSTVAYNGTIFIWDTLTGKQLYSFNEGKTATKYYAYSPNVDALAIHNHGGNLSVFSLLTGKKTVTIDPEHVANALAFSPDGKYLAYGTRNGQVFRLPMLSPDELIEEALLQTKGRKLTEKERGKFYLSQ